MTLFGPANTALAANTIPKILNYQARITNASGVPVPDGALSIKVAIYDSLSGGSCLYSLRGTCGVPVGFSATTTAGVFSILIGDTTQNALPDDLFDGNDRYLGITIATDSEMTPRKRIASAPYAFNADRLDDLDSSSTGGTSAHILAATSNGNLAITGDPQGSGIGDGSVYINPASASAGETIFGVADNGSLRFRLNKEGDITQTGSLLATAASPTSRFIFKGAASQSTDIFEVRDTSDLLALGVSATSTQIWGDLTTIRSVSYSWPSTQGGASTVLQNNGGGVLSWATVSSGVANLQAAYNAASSTTELSISGGNALTVADTLSGVGNIFEIQDLTDPATGNYSSRYFTVSSTATTIGGNAIVNGNTTLGDASGDTLTSKFGTWNFVNDVFANLGDASLTFQSTLATVSTVSFVADALTSGTALYVSSSADRSSSGSLLRLSDTGATGMDNSGLSILSSNASAAAQAITIDLDNGNNNNIVFSVTTDETTTSGTSADTEKFAILASGSVRGDGNLTIGSASGTNTVDFTGARIASNLTPTTDATFDLGDYNRRWKDLWLSGGSANIALDQSGTSIMRLGFESTEGLRGFIKTPDSIPLQLRSGNVGSSGVYITSTGTTISDLTVTGTCTGCGSTSLNQAYADSSATGTEIYLDSTHGALTLADSFSSFGGNLFEIQDRTNGAGDYSQRYFTVSSTATEITTNLLVTGTAGSFPEVSGAGTRLMYIPSYSGAFRAGQVAGTQWDSGNVGLGSAAFGNDTTASGFASFAMGSGTTASGDYSTAFGFNTSVTGNRGFATGDTTTAGQDGFAAGSLTSATGSNSVAIGDTSHAGGSNAFAGGFEATASGLDSFAFGANARASGSISTAIGQNLFTAVSNSMVFGHGVSSANPLINDITDSMMIGFNSNIPTFFVGPASGAGTVGDVGIGTKVPSSKLTIADAAVSPSTDIFEIQNTSGGGGYSARYFTVSSTSTQILNSRLLAPAHAANQGLRIPTFSGVPTAVTGQQIGDIVWDSASANFYGYDGASFVFIGGGSMTLQQAYDNYTTNGTGTTEIYLGGVRGGLTLADSYSSFGGNLFEIQDRSTTAGDWSQRYFTVSSTSTSIGSASSTYALDLSGARIGSNLTPTTDATFDLGDYNRRWKDLWLSGGSANIALDQSGTSIMRLGFESTNGLRGLIKTPDEIPLQLRSGNVDASGITITSSGSTISNLIVTGTCTNCGGGTATMQGAYDNDVNGGNVTVTTNSTDGAIVIAGDQQFQVSSTGGTRLGSGALTTQTALTLNETALTTGTLLQVFGGTAMNGTAMAVISASGTASNGSYRTALFKYEGTLFGGGGGDHRLDSGLNDWLVRSRVSSTDTFGIVGYHFGFRNETSGPVVQTALRIAQEQNDETSSDNVLDNLLVLDNADTSTGGSQTVTNAIRITNSGNAAGGIVTALNIDDADITTDLSLQNGETIDNNTDGIIAFTGGGTLLKSLDINTAAATSQTILDVDASGLTSGSGLSMTAGALQTGVLLKVFGGTDMSGTAMAVISASGTASNGSNRTALFKYDSTLFGGGGGSSLSDSGLHDWLVRSRISGGGVTGYHFGFRNETSGGVAFQNALNIVLEQNDESSASSALDNLLVLDNADTSTGSSQTVTNAIRITNSGNVAGGIVNAINIDDADITTDISLQNGETIDNNTNGTITFGSDITLNFSGTATTNGVCHSGANSDTTATARALVVCSGAPADIAEWYPTDGTPSAGDILVASDSVLTYESDSFDPLTGMARGYKDSHTVSVLDKASAPYAEKIIGVVSTSPYQVFGRGLLDATSNAAPVAVAGRVPAKVSIENGNIKAGDPITTSSAPGIGMKATKPGMIVGYALGAWNGPGQGTIEVFVNPGWHAGETIGTDGAMSLFKDAFAFDSTGIASASSASLSSYALNFKSSAWDSASDTAVSRNISVLGEAATPADYQLAFRNDEGNLLAALNQSGDLSIAGSLSVEGGFDYAEMFPAVPDIESGDIVMVDPSAEFTPAKAGAVKKTQGPYENAAIGVISTKPGFLTGKKDEAGSQPVALAGRVPVKVNVENGSIAPGDPITSSSTPGVGMKATQAGRVIGIALQAATDDGVILAFVNPSWWNGPMPVGSASVGGSLDIGQDSLLDFKNSVLSDVAAIISTNGMWGITADGHMIAKKVETETLQTEDVVLVQSEAKASTSEGVVLAGYTATVVQNPAMKPNSKVFVSFLDDPRGSYWVAEKGEGSFTVHLSTPALVDLSFEYWIVGVEDRRPSPSPVIPAEAGAQAATDTEPAPIPDPATDVIGSGSGTEETGSASGTEEIGG